MIWFCILTGFRQKQASRQEPVADISWWFTAANRAKCTLRPPSTPANANDDSLISVVEDFSSPQILPANWMWMKHFWSQAVAICWNWLRKPALLLVRAMQVYPHDGAEASQPMVGLCLYCAKNCEAFSLGKKWEMEMCPSAGRSSKN